MGIFDMFKGKEDQVEAKVEAAAGGGGMAAGADDEAAIAGLLGEGGLSSLLDKFDAGGLGDKVKSWVGKGENLPVSVDEIKSVVSLDQISGVASKLGISADEAAAKIAGVLPAVIDKLTPDGLVPDPDSLAQKLTGFFNK